MSRMRSPIWPTKGFLVLTALCEHAPFDLVAYRDGTFVRVQVKYRTLAPNGAIKVNFVSSWSDSRGTYHPPIDKQEVDVVCIYCPDTGACYDVDPKAFRISVSLRVRPSGNGQARNVLIADDYRGVPTALGVRHVGTTPIPTVS